MDITPSMRQALTQWGTIQAAVEGGVSTRDLWSAIYNDALTSTGSVPRFSFGDVTQLRSLAVRNREASRQFNAEQPGIAIGPEHIGAIPHAAPAAALGLPQRYIVQFEHRVIRNGVEVAQWRTDVFDYGLPATKQSLLNRLNRDGANLAEDYENETHLGIGDVRLLAA